MRSLSLTPRECIDALSVLPGAYWLRDGPHAFAGALPTARTSAIDPEPGAWSFQEPGLPSFPRWVGLLPYEGFRTVEGTDRQLDARPHALVRECLWQKYGAALKFEGQRVIALGETEAEEARLVEAIRGAQRGRAQVSLEWFEAPEPDEKHMERVRTALDWIAAGRIYQVNLARRLRLRARGSPIGLLARLGDGGENALDLGGARFGFALDLGDLSCVSLSPELCLSLDPNREVLTSPIKGTRPRSRVPERDSQLAFELEESEKERAELTMVIDLERNDLARVAETGTVRLSEGPRVVTHPTVHHREATVAARLREGVSRTELLSALLPSGSVTGAPKKSAMSAIRELEAYRRGLYTGALGYLGQDGSLRLSMAIRSMTIHQEIAEYFVGGGIVADSDPLAEVEETRWKAEQLARLVLGRFA